MKKSKIKKIQKNKELITRYEINMVFLELLFGSFGFDEITIKKSSYLQPVDYTVTHNKNLKNYYIFIASTTGKSSNTIQKISDLKEMVKGFFDDDHLIILTTSEGNYDTIEFENTHIINIDSLEDLRLIGDKHQSKIVDKEELFQKLLKIIG